MSTYGPERGPARANHLGLRALRIRIALDRGLLAGRPAPLFAAIIPPGGTETNPPIAEKIEKAGKLGLPLVNFLRLLGSRFRADAARRLSACQEAGLVSRSKQGVLTKKGGGQVE